MAEKPPDDHIEIREDGDGDNTPPLGLPPFPFLFDLLDAVHAALDWLACNDPRNATRPFASQIEASIEYLDDLRYCLRLAYPGPDSEPPPDVIICRRTRPNVTAGRGLATCSIPQRIVQHSPAGFEWGYGGSGPADLALNILAVFLPVGCDGEEPLPLFRGKCSRIAWALHQEFKRDVIARLPLDGGEITADDVREWVVAHADGKYMMR